MFRCLTPVFRFLTPVCGFPQGDRRQRRTLFFTGGLRVPPHTRFGVWGFGYRGWVGVWGRVRGTEREKASTPFLQVDTQPSTIYPQPSILIRQTRITKRFRVSGRHTTINHQPSTLKVQPSNLYPSSTKHQTVEGSGQTQHHQPSTLNPRILIRQKQITERFRV